MAKRRNVKWWALAGAALIFGLVLGGVIRDALGDGLSMSDWLSTGSFIGNTVMAVAAASAFFLWRSQLKGSRQHEIAAEVLRLTYEVHRALAVASIAVQEELLNQSTIDESDAASGTALPRPRSFPALAKPQESLRDSVESLMEAAEQVQVHWSHEDALMVRSFCEYAALQQRDLNALGLHLARVSDNVATKRPPPKAPKYSPNGVVGDHMPFIAELLPKVQQIEDWAAVPLNREPTLRTEYKVRGPKAEWSTEAKLEK